MHLIENSKLLLVFANQQSKITAYLINPQSWQVEEKLHFNHDECLNFDLHLVHPTSIFCSNRIYLFQSGNIEEKQNVYILDATIKKVLPISNFQHPPSTFRIKHSIAFDAEGPKAYLFGGLDLNMNLLNSLEVFDFLTYNFQLVQTKGKSPAGRHSHCSQIYNNILYILGGIKNRDIFDSNSMIYEEELFLLDLNSLSWTPVRMLGTIPKSLFNCEWLLLGKYGIIVYNEENSTQIKRLDMTQFEFEDL